MIYLTIKTLVILFIIFFVSFILLQRFTNNNFSLFGYRIFSVATGSMAPLYNINDVLLCKNVDTKTIVEGDDLTYLGNTGSYKDKVVTHRVIRIDTIDNKLVFHTKGLASTAEDPVVSEDQVYGIVVKKLNFLSKFRNFTSEKTGFFICIIIPMLFLIGSEIVQSMLDNYENKLNKANM
jgi:signal peptidase